MKKAVLITLSSLSLGLLFVYPAVAKVNVEISNNGEGSSNEVKVNNSVKVNGESTSKSETNVKITTNGETKEYHSDGVEDINIQSSDGSSKVQIINNGSSKSSTRIIDNEDEKELSKSDEDKEKTKTEVKKKIKKNKSELRENKKDNSDFIEDQLNFFKSLIFFWIK